MASVIVSVGVGAAVTKVTSPAGTTGDAATGTVVIDSVSLGSIRRSGFSFLPAFVCATDFVPLGKIRTGNEFTGLSTTPEAGEFEGGTAGVSVLIGEIILTDCGSGELFVGVPPVVWIGANESGVLS